MTAPRTPPRRSALATALALAGALGISVTGCFGEPEICLTCPANGGNAADGSGGAGTTGAGGDTAGSGGGPGVGGVIGTGGAAGTGGAVGTGGSTGSGGAVGTGGSTGSGGAVGTGGSTGSGGAVGTGGAGTGGAGTGGTGTGGSPGTGGAVVLDPDLVLWYKFDEASGTTAVDAAMAGGTARNATLSGTGAGFSASTRSMAAGTHALDLMPGGAGGASGGFATLPAVPTLAPAAATYSLWVYVRADQNWQRVFDFGSSSTTTYMFLTTHAAGGGTPNNVVRFSITTAGNGGEQQIGGTSLLSLNAWHHVAVVLGAAATYTGTLYVDGASAGTNAAMTSHPSSLGTSTNNWLGRSQFTADPYFNGSIDDFRVYKRALTAAEIGALAGTPP